MLHSRVFIAVLTALVVAATIGCPAAGAQESSPEDIAQRWAALANDAMWALEQGPPIEARTMFHLSIAMYDAWAAYNDTAMGYLIGDGHKQPERARTPENRAETLSHAAFTVLTDRFERFRLWPRNADPRLAYEAFFEKMRELGYLRARGGMRESEAQALGKQIGEMVIAFAESDGANEDNNYRDPTYVPSNPHIVSGEMGTGGMKHPDLWQPIITPDDDNNADNDQIYRTGERCAHSASRPTPRTACAFPSRPCRPTKAIAPATSQCSWKFSATAACSTPTSAAAQKRSTSPRVYGGRIG